VPELVQRPVLANDAALHRNLMAAAANSPVVVVGHLEIARYHEHVRAFLTLAEAVAAAQDCQPGPLTQAA
jgi:hypothetical protein